MRPTAISLSPNTQKDDVFKALSTLLMPWTWNSKKPVLALEQAFKEYFSDELNFTAINSGRSALYIILASLGIKENDEVLVQSFTCVAVPNAVHWTGATPIFVDIDTSLNISLEDIKKRISKKTKAIVVQHTFGIPAEIDEIKKLCKEKNLFLIEDCAHALGASYKNKKIGTYGDASFFSFGRDKVISSVFGGMIATMDKKLHKKVENEVGKLGTNRPGWIFQQLLHPILFNFLILPFYTFGVGKLSLGKVLLFAFQTIGLLSKPVYKEELQTGRPEDFPKRMSGALASLALLQFGKLEEFNANREKVVNLYSQKLKLPNNTLVTGRSGAIWLRYPLLIANPDKLFRKAQAQGILLGKWYSNVVDPKCNLNKVGYKKQSCPYSEEVADKIINLPTYPLLSDKEVAAVIKIVNSYNA